MVHKSSGKISFIEVIKNYKIIIVADRSFLRPARHEVRLVFCVNEGFFFGIPLGCWKCHATLANQWRRTFSKHCYTLE